MRSSTAAGAGCCSPIPSPRPTRSPPNSRARPTASGTSHFICPIRMSWFRSRRRSCFSIRRTPTGCGSISTARRRRGTASTPSASCGPGATVPASTRSTAPAPWCRPATPSGRRSRIPDRSRCWWRRITPAATSSASHSGSITNARSAIRKTARAFGPSRSLRPRRIPGSAKCCRAILPNISRPAAAPSWTCR